jgi:Tfp pilus assembly protein PilF
MKRAGDLRSTFGSGNKLPILLLAFLPFLTINQAFAQPAAKSTPAPGDSFLAMIQGSVEVARAGSDAWGRGVLRQALYPGDRVRTGERSRAEIFLSGGTAVTESEGSQYEVPRPAPVTFKKGLYKISNRNKHKSSDLGLPGATAAIRGTDFIVAVSDEYTEVTVLDGEVVLRNGGGELDLTNNQRGIVEPNGALRRAKFVEPVNDVIQWCLYYPGVLNARELPFTDAEREILKESLDAYLDGDLPRAVEAYPWQTPVGSSSAQAYRAALLLSVGQVEQAQAAARASGDTAAARSVQTLIEAVKFEAGDETNWPQTSSEWLAESYVRQSRYDLMGALEAAKEATNSPNFGFALERVAELEFSFGHTDDALAALRKSLEVAPRNAQAVALQGFLLSARDEIPAATKLFDQAIELDSALGNAWLGRGLCRIRQGDAGGGLDDLTIAASLEPQRSLLRSYLAKAFADTGDDAHAAREFLLAMQIDPHDPTPWLYSAIYRQERHRLNEAVRDLEKSLDLNDNRQLYRSRMLLDEDRAVRSASLAAIYRDDGMIDVAVREAARAVSDDYANYSAHLFLANSFDSLRDPTRFNLRYETVWFNELLLANLLSPVGAGTFSQSISQQEYSRLFDVKTFGLTSSSEYRSDGQYREVASQFGNYGNLGYALDLDYQHNDGFRPNNELNRIEWYSTLKYELTPGDMLFLQTKYQDYHSGDNFQYYDWHQSVRTNYTFDEYQTPLIVGGYHREWSQGIHTLVLAGHLNNDQRFSDVAVSNLVLVRSAPGGQATAAFNQPFNVKLRSQFDAYTAELSQIFQSERQLLILGGRFQSGQFNTENQLDASSFANFFPTPHAALTNVSDDFQRETAYAYYTIQPLTNLFLTGGITLDSVEFPDNFRNPPIAPGRERRGLASPKAAILYEPCRQITLRGAYSRSLGGVSLDESFRLEPTQLAGFIQTYRSVIPESIVGSVSAENVETYDAAIDLKPADGTYIGLQLQELTSHVDQEVGDFDFYSIPFTTGTPASTPENLDFRERSVGLTANQMLADEWVLGAGYLFTSDQLTAAFPQIPVTVSAGAKNTSQSDLHQIGAYLLFNHPSGFFARAEANWYHQDNSFRNDNGVPTADQPGGDFTQFNFYAGWRFPRQHGDLTLGVLNIGGGDYHLNPLNTYAELPHSRVFYAQLRFRF